MLTKLAPPETHLTARFKVQVKASSILREDSAELCLKSLRIRERSRRLREIAQRIRDLRPQRRP